MNNSHWDYDFDDDWEEDEDYEDWEDDWEEDDDNGPTGHGDICCSDADSGL